MISVPADDLLTAVVSDSCSSHSEDIIPFFTKDLIELTEEDIGQLDIS